MKMKRKALQLAAAGTIALAAFAVAGASQAPTASAATFFPCTHGGHPGECGFLQRPETLWEANNTVNRFMNAGDEVEVECWYSGGGPVQPALGIWDHIVWVQRAGAPTGSLVLGHLDHAGVDFGGLLPSQLGLPHCG
jgi:hypothetical protein